MSSRKKQQKAALAAAASPAKPGRLYASGAAAALLLAFIAYGPALRGPFLFDDTYLPFGLPDPPEALSGWLGAIRPVLMTTYWANYRFSGLDSFSYHVAGVLIHVAASLLVFLVLRRLCERAGAEGARRDLTAAVGAAVFLLHPVQAESVAYIAGRSESLSVMFLMAAYAVFLYRPAAISWPRAAAVLALFGAALLSKEHVVVLLPLMLLTDFWWNPGFTLEGMRRNWRLYAPMALGAALGVALFWQLITRASTAGFGMKDVSWHQYLFTQFRALFVYLRLFVLPFDLTVDYDFPFSRTILEHGSVAGLIALLAITAAAWRWRREHPLASFGWFAFLLLMAPTSSILPIKDPIAERRLYLGMPGLLLIVAGTLMRLKLDRARLAMALGGVCLAGLMATHARAKVWAGPIVLWQDAVAKTPNKARPRFQLAAAWMKEGRCDLAASEFAATARLQTPNYDLLVDWALALECLNQPDAAIEKLREAAKLEPSAHVYSQIGMVYAKQSRWAEAMEALERGQAIDPNYAPIYTYKGGVHLSTGNAAAAIEEYRRALASDERNEQARQGLAMAEKMLRAPRR